MKKITQIRHNLFHFAFDLVNHKSIGSLLPQACKLVFTLTLPILLTSCLEKSGNDQVSSGTLGLELKIMSGNNQDGDPNRLYSESLTVMVQDASGDAVKDIEVEFFEISSKGAYVTNASGKTNSSGQVSTDVRAPTSHGASIIIGARIRNSSTGVEFNLSTSDTPEGGRFKVTSTNSGTEMAGDAFGFKVELVGETGGLLDYNGTVTTQWLIDTQESWGKVAPSVLPATYDCVFIGGVCDIPAIVTLTDAENITYIYMGDGVEGFQDVFAQPIIVQKNVAEKVVVVKNAPGGPAAGAEVLADEILNTDMAMFKIYGAITDKAGNYITDAGSVTWTSDRTEITNNLVDNGDGSADFTPAKTIPFPTRGKIFADVAPYPQGSSGNLAIDPGAPAEILMIPSDSNYIRTAGEYMKFRLEVRDANNNLVGQNNTNQGYTGAINVKLEFADYLSDDEVAGGVVPEVMLPSADGAPEYSRFDFESFQATEYNFVTQFSAGLSSVGEISRGIVFWDGTSVSPKITVTATSASLGDVSTTTTFNVVPGPEYRIQLRDGPGASGKSVCEARYGTTAGDSTSLDEYFSVYTGDQNQAGRPQASSPCTGMNFQAGDAPVTFYYALEDRAGNYLGPATASLDLMVNSSATSDFDGQFSPVGTSASTTLTPLGVTSSNDNWIDVIGTVNGSTMYSRFEGDIDPANLDKFVIGMYDGDARRFKTDGVIFAGKVRELQIRALDQYGNTINNFGTTSFPYNRDFNIALSAPFNLSPNGTPPSFIGLGNQTLSFQGGVAKYFITLTNTSDTPTLSMTDLHMTNPKPVDPLTFDIRAGDPSYIELRTALDGGGVDYTNQVMNLTTDDAVVIFANIFDGLGNYKTCSNVDWIYPGLTYFNPADSMVFTDVGCSTFLQPQKPTIAASRLGAYYTWTDSDGNDFIITAQTDDITVDTGNLATMQVAPDSLNLEAGETTNVTVTLKDAKGNTLSDTGTKGVAITSVDNGITRLGHAQSLSNTSSLDFIAGEATFTATFYNSTKTPSLNLSTTSAPFVSGQTSAFTITSAPLDHLWLRTGGGLTEVDAGVSNTYAIFAEDAWGNRLTSGLGSAIDVTFELTNPALTTQDILSTTLTGATSVAGPNDTSVTGNLTAGAAQVQVVSTTAGEMQVNGTSTAGIIEGNNTEEYLQIMPLSTIDHISFNPAPKLTHTASPSLPIFPFSVELRDIYDNVITTENSETIDITLDTGTGSISGTTNKSVSAGKVQFDDLIYTKAEAITLRASLDSDGGKTITAPITVNVGGATQSIVALPDQIFTEGVSSLGAAISGGSFSGTNAVDVGTPFVVKVYVVDDAFNKSSGYGFPVTLTSTDPNAVISAPVVPIGGEATFNVTMKSQGNHTFTASASGVTNEDSTSFAANPLAASQLLVLLPGQVLEEGADNLDDAIDNPATTTQTAGTAFNVTVVAVDNYYNKVTDKDGSSVSITTSDPNDAHPSSENLASGEATFSVTNLTALSNQKVVPSGAAITPRDSELYDIAPGTAIKTIVRMPGQSHNPGTISYGTALQNAASDQAAGVSFTVDVYAVDAYFNIDTNYNGALSIVTPGDPNDTEPVAPTNFSSGQASFTINPVKANSGQQISVSSGLNDVAHAPASYDVNPGAKRFLLSLFDNQSLTQGVTSLAAAVTPTAIPAKNAGDSINITVYGTDIHYNVINDGSLVSVSTTAPNDDHPAAKNLVSGSTTFTIQNYKSGTGYTVSASGGGYPVSQASNTYNINAGSVTNVIALLPGESLSEGHDTFAEASSGNPSDQTNGVYFPVTLYSTDNYYNRVNSSVTVDISAPLGTAASSGSTSFAGGSMVQINLQHSASGSNQVVRPSSTLNDIDSDQYDVVASLSAPTLALSDPNTSSTSYARQQNIDVNITNGATIAFWCLSESQSSNPSLGVNNRGTCTGGTGGAGAGWHSSKPGGFNLSAGDGNKTVYLWVADSANNVYGTAESDTIYLKTSKPAVPSVALEDPDSSSTTHTNNLTTDLTITGDTDAVAWWVDERADAASAPSAPLYNDGAWLGTRPTTIDMGGNGLRKVYVYTKDIADNVSVSAATQTIYYDPVAPGGALSIVGVAGGAVDSTYDTTLSASLTPTIAFLPATDATSITYTMNVQTLASADACTPEVVTSSDPLEFTGCTLTDGVTYKVLLTATDQAGNISAASNSGTFQFTVVDGLAQFVVTKVLPGNAVSDTSFDIQIEAQNAGGSTVTAYDGFKTIDFSTDGSNGGTRCGASGGALIPSTPGQDASINFSNGFATVSVTLKKAESGVSISVQEDGSAVAGTLSGLTVDAGAQNCIRIETANDGSGALLGAQALSIDGIFSAHAVAYDSQGNFLSSPSVNWSGSADLAQLPIPTTGSSTTIVASKLGSGNLTASGSSDSVSVTVSGGTVDRSFTSSSFDNESVNHLEDDSIELIKQWDVSSDNVVAWRTDSGLSWHTETKGTTTRGTRANFPLQARLALTSDSLEILDAASNDLFMRFDRGPGLALDTGLGSITSLDARDGMIFLGYDDSTNGALVIIDLANDNFHRLTASDNLIFNRDISQRNSAGTWSGGTSGYPQLTTSGDRVYSLAAHNDGTDSFVAVGTQNGINVLRLTGTPGTFKNTTANPVQQIQIASDDKLYFFEETVGLNRSDISLPLGSDFPVDHTYTLTSAGELLTLDANGMSLQESRSAADPGQNLIFIASDKGLSAIHEHSTDTSAESKNFVLSGSGSYPFSGALALDGTSGTLSIANSASMTNSLTIEFWFKPDATLNSGSAASGIFSVGSPTVDGFMGLTHNASADGKLEFSVRHSGSTYKVASTETSFSANTWYHVAVTIDGASGIDMWINGNNNQFNPIDLSGFTPEGASNLIFGSDGTNYFAGLIDEIRISSSAVYSTASFAVPGTELSNVGAIHLFHLNENSGGTAAYSDTDAMVNGTLGGNSLFVYPLIPGSSQSIKDLSSITHSGSTSTQIITSNYWYEISNSDDVEGTTSSMSDSLSLGSGVNQAEVYNIDSSTDYDLLLGTPANGLRTLRE